MTPDKYTAIAEALVNDVDEECSGWGFELTKAIAQAIADAVNEERERMVVVWPSEAETMEWLNAIGRPTYGAYLDWLSTHAKVGVRDET